MEPIPAPKYLTFEAFIANTPLREIRSWCTKKAKRANRYQNFSANPDEKLTTDHVFEILKAAKGRCYYCNSLAVEGAPVDPLTGKTLPWELIGRRIGSLDHVIPRFSGGRNHSSNLVWCCHWCNTWPAERVSNATDHGAIQ